MLTLNDWAARIHECSVDHGFWPEDGRNFGEMIALAHSELSEALEEHRSSRPAVWYKHSHSCHGGGHQWPYVANPDLCNCNPKPEGIAVELLDAIIRCLDTMQSLGVDIDDLMERKVAYNEGRPFKHGRDY